MSSPFGQYLYELIDRQGLSVREFARRAKTHEPALSAIRNGRRPAPLARVDRWADLLDLKAAERERLLDLAALTHAPGRIQDLVARVERGSGKTVREWIETRGW